MDPTDQNDDRQAEPLPIMTVGFTLRPRFSVAQLLVAIALSAFALQIVLNGMYAPQAGSVYCVCCSPNGKIVATGSEDHSIRLWDTVTQRSTIFAGHRNLVRSLAFSADGTRLASGSLDTTVRIWEVATGKELATLPGHTCANAVSFSPDGKLLAVGDWARFAVHIWDLESKTLLATLVGHTDSVSSVSFSPDGKTLASGSEDGTVKLWDAAAMKQRANLIVGDSVMSIAFSPDSQIIAVGREVAGVTLWDATKASELCTLEGDSERLTSVSFSPDGRLLATGSATEHIHTVFPGNVRFTRVNRPSFVGVRLWDVSTRMLLSSHPSSTTVWSVAFSADGESLAGSGEHWATRVWNVRSGKEELELVARRPRAVLVWYILGAAMALWVLARTRRRLPP